jgi:quercetin dioxygenase-like cupin family protein
MTIAYWSIKADSAMPEHAHPHEQIVNLIEGEFELTLGDESKIMRPGDIAAIPPDLPHSGKSISDCLIIDVFHPVREDFKQSK